ncbi:MAG: MG2 domain-containing protein [Candidatus Roizmanbacteria bacterium]
MTDIKEIESSPKKPFALNKFLYSLITIFVIVVIFSGFYVFFNKNAVYKFEQLVKETLSPKDIGTFELTDLSPRWYQNDFSVNGIPTFVFSQKINASNDEINNIFSIKPLVNGKWIIEPNGYAVSFVPSSQSNSEGLYKPFVYDTNYTITIAKQIRSTVGNTFKDDEVIHFKTLKDPRFTLELEKKLISVSPGKKARVNLYSSKINVSEVYKLSVSKATVDNVLAYFTYGLSNSFLYDTSLINTNNAQTYDINVQYTNQQPQIEMPAFDKPGIYYLTVGNKYGKDEFFVSVSNHISVAQIDNQEIYVWNTDSETGKRIPNANVALYSLQNVSTKVDEGVTNQDGLYHLKNGSQVDLIVSQQGEETSIVYTPNYITRVSEIPIIYSYTDRPIYRPGDKVNYKAILRTRNNGKYEVYKNPLYIAFFTGSGSIPDSKYQLTTPDENGTITQTVQLPKNMIGAYPQIVIASKNDKGTFDQIHYYGINVQAYKKPDLEVKVTADKIEYISKDTAELKVSATSLYGQPLVNTPFNFRIISNEFSEEQDRSIESLTDIYVNYYGGGTELISGSGAFDGDGKAILSFSTDLKKYEKSQVLLVEITPKIGASPSFGKIALLVHKGTIGLFFEGISADTEKGISGDILSLDHHNPRNPISNKTIELALEKLTNDTTREKVASQSVTTNDLGSAHFNYEKVEKGRYELTAQSIDERENIVLIRQQIIVGDIVQSTIPNVQRINLSLDKEIYKPGETARIQMNSSFLMSDGFVTLSTTSSNRGMFTSPKILQATIENIGQNSYTFSVPIAKDQGLPLGFHISSVFDGQVVRELIQIPIYFKDKQISTSISFDKGMVKPGDTVNATIKTLTKDNKPISADVSLSLIDSAVLQIGKISTNIYDTFYPIYASLYVSEIDSTTGIFRDSAGGGGGCFLEGTPIKMNNGADKIIENINVGDVVLSRISPSVNILIPDVVTRTFRHIVSEYLTINETIKVTPIHRIYVNKEWKQASEIQVGDEVVGVDGNIIRVTKISHHTGRFVVYNFTTEKTHTYFASGIYVHNEKGPSPRQNFADSAYWNPHIQTDENGVATVSIKLPDNATTFTAYAVANTKDSLVGQGFAEVIAKKDIVIIPSVPQFIFEGDKPQLSALIQNTKDRPVLLDVSLQIKSSNYNSSQNIQIPAGEYKNVFFDYDVKDTKNIELKFDVFENGTSVDSVLTKILVLPKGSVQGGWTAVESNTSIDLQSKYPQLDANMIHISANTHPAHILLGKEEYQLDNKYQRSRTSQTGVSRGLYIWSYGYAVGQGYIGNIDPRYFPYASYKNDIREMYAQLLTEKVDVNNGLYWMKSPYDPDESDAITTYLTTLGLQELKSYQVFKDFVGISSLIERAKIGVIDAKISRNNSNDEIVLQSFFDANLPCEKVAETTINCTAIKIRKGLVSGTQQLRSMAVRSADDRYVWNNENSVFLKILPALTVVEKGTEAEADKVIRGLVSDDNSSNLYSSENITMLTGLKHIVRKKYSFSQPDYELLFNDKSIFNSKDSSYYLYSKFDQIMPTTSTDGNIHIKVVSNSDIPVYLAVSQLDYRIDQLPLNRAIMFDDKISRTYRSLEGKNISNINPGETGVIEIKASSPITLKKDSSGLRSSFLNVNFIPSNMMYLNQSDMNSPQYDSILKNIYPSGVNYVSGYTTPTEYSDEFVYFYSNSQTDTIILPSVMYGISKGLYYQPKTSIVFPNLGIIYQEQ